LKTLDEDLDLQAIMKRSVVIPVVVGVLLIGVIALAFVPVREPVSLTLVRYQRWPHGATLKLSNDTTKTISYLTEQGGYTPTLFRQKTGNGWTASPPLMSQLSVLSYIQNGAFVSDTNLFILVGVPGNSPNAGRSHVFQAHELKPGRSAELYVSLEPDAPPIGVGTVCIIPQGKFAQQFGQWMAHIKRWCHLKSNLPGQFELWCDEPLQVSLKPTRAEQQ
jgi:hypothetical protein